MHKAQTCSGDSLRRHFGSTTKKIKIPSTALRNPVPSAAQLMATDWREMTGPHRNADALLQALLGTSAGTVRYCLCDKKPCHYVWKRSGCRNGAECDFCHKEHECQGPIDRPSKQERKRLKQIVQGLIAQGASPEILEACAQHRQYIRRLLLQHLVTAEDQNSRAHPLALPPLRARDQGLIRKETSPPLRQSKDATTSCSKDNDRKPHRERFREIGERLQWPGTQMQSSADSDDGGSMTASEKAYELALRECVASKM